MKIAIMEDEELIEEFRDMWESVNVTDCFGPRDVQLLMIYTSELQSRGYEIVESVDVRKVSG